EYHRLTGKAPLDEPHIVSGSSRVEAFDKAIAPYVAKALSAYASAKRRFLAGLPRGYQFSVQIALYDPNRDRENCFVDVESIKNGKISGIINSHVDVLKSYKRGQRITFPESDVFNWVIVRPDGIEEGNYVGKSLDRYKPR